jgi:uncharacterized membrane protein YphA (DoxX/SURF4 family)
LRHTQVRIQLAQPASHGTPGAPQCKNLRFVWDGIVMLRNPSGTAQYFASVHVPAPNIAVWPAIPVHLLGGVALLVGFYHLACCQF